MLKNNEDKRNKIDHPDAKKHMIISFIKSAIRIVGYAAMIYVGGWIAIAGGILLLAEAVGIWEELV